MKILIAEDDAVSRMVLLSKLKKLSHSVLIAEDGEQAWTLFQQEHPNIVISDWMMPKMDGLQLVRNIRQSDLPLYTYIILLTALGGKGSFLEGMHAGADDYMTKPFDMDELTARLIVAERILGLQTQVKQLEGLLPICSYCKKIRDDQNSWQQIEHYIALKTETSFSHGICPDCYEKYVRPQLDRMKNK